jgi:hypothetical protein
VGRGTWRRRRGGVWLASEAHVGAKPEATAWSATLTRMRRSWAMVGQLARHVGRERKGGLVGSCCRAGRPGKESGHGC